MADQDPGPVPSRWLNCPRKATGLIAGKFLAFKTPLGPQFNNKVPEEHRFTPSMLFMFMKSLKVKLGLWIDLTNTSRFYDKKEIEDKDCKYIKLPCRGHGETPSNEQIRVFMEIVSRFCSQNPLEVICIHCTHGFNRTGFLLVCYMVEELDWSVEAAITEFARIRPPGIYKQDYLEELYKKYDDVEATPAAPMRPDWCNEDDLEYDDEDEVAENSYSNDQKQSKGKGKNKRELNIKKSIFLPGVDNVIPFTAQPKLAKLQKKVQDMCGWQKNGFPGSQPVSMSVTNMKLLLEKPYRVSWKADGTRYMTLIDGENEVYMFDRDYCVFKVNGLRFVAKKDLKRHLKNTLLDGEMVIDKVNGKDIPRYLCYDIITFEGINVSKQPFHPTRMACIENEIVNPRHEAMKAGLIRKEKDPFSVRLKQFWDIPMAQQLLGEKFAKSLSHEPDGLIFQPSLEPYKAGRCDDVLKWKPAELNSVDFLLKIVKEEGLGIVPKKVGQLFVGQLNKPFATIRATKDIKHLDNKIVECKVENNQWVVMRERTDKSFPNSYNTAKAVWESICNPVTKEKLFCLIDSKRLQDDTEIMPPPKRVKR